MGKKQKEKKFLPKEMLFYQFDIGELLFVI